MNLAREGSSVQLKHDPFASHTVTRGLNCARMGDGLGRQFLELSIALTPSRHVT